jgi:hypothetical protein
VCGVRSGRRGPSDWRVEVGDRLSGLTSPRHICCPSDVPSSPAGALPPFTCKQHPTLRVSTQLNDRPVWLDNRPGALLPAMTVPASQAASARRSARRRTVEGDRTDRRQAILLAAEKRCLPSVATTRSRSARLPMQPACRWHWWTTTSARSMSCSSPSSTTGATPSSERLQRLREARAEADRRRPAPRGRGLRDAGAARCAAAPRASSTPSWWRANWSTARPRPTACWPSYFDPMAHAFIDALHAIARRPAAPTPPGPTSLRWARSCTTSATTASSGCRAAPTGPPTRPPRRCWWTSSAPASRPCCRHPGNATGVRAPVPLTTETTEETA